MYKALSTLLSALAWPFIKLAQLFVPRHGLDNLNKSWTAAAKAGHPSTEFMHSSQTPPQPQPQPAPYVTVSEKNQALFNLLRKQAPSIKGDQTEITCSREAFEVAKKHIAVINFDQPAIDNLMITKEYYTTRYDEAKYRSDGQQMRVCNFNLTKINKKIKTASQKLDNPTRELDFLHRIAAVDPWLTPDRIGYENNKTIASDPNSVTDTTRSVRQNILAALNEPANNVHHDVTAEM